MLGYVLYLYFFLFSLCLNVREAKPVWLVSECTFSSVEVHLLVNASGSQNRSDFAISVPR